MGAAKSSSKGANKGKDKEADPWADNYQLEEAKGVCVSLCICVFFAPSAYHACVFHGVRSTKKVWC